MNIPTPKKPEQDNTSRASVIRIAIWVLASSICQGLLIVAVYFSSHNLSALAIFLFSLVPSIILGFAFTIIQNLYENTENNTRNVVRNEESLYQTQEQLSETIDEFRSLVRDTGTTLKFYSTIRKILDDGYKQKDLIRDFLNRAMNGPLYIMPMEAYEYYDLAEKGINECSHSWQAIHQGSITQLEVHFRYLDELKKRKRQTGSLLKQRIVILNDEEIKELSSPLIVENFLTATEGTKSYYIREDVFFAEFGLTKGSVDDAALHDGKLLTTRRREIKLVMLALPGHNDKSYQGIIRAFEKLNHDLRLDRDLRSSYFHLIEQPKPV